MVSALGINAKLQKTKVVTPVGQTRPPEGWAKLNSNGFAFGNSGKARGRGVFRNHDGECIKGYARPLDYTSRTLGLKGWLDIGKGNGTAQTYHGAGCFKCC